MRLQQYSTTSKNLVRDTSSLTRHTLLNFSRDHRLRVRRDACSELFIQAKFGEIFADEQDLCVAFLGHAQDHSWDNRLRSRIRRAIAAGFFPVQIGDFEGILRFPVGSANVAIKLVGAKRKRIPSTAQLLNLKKFSLQRHETPTKATMSSGRSQDVIPAPGDSNSNHVAEVE